MHLILKVKNRYSVSHSGGRWKIIYDAAIANEESAAAIVKAYRTTFPVDRYAYQYTVEVK